MSKKPDALGDRLKSYEAVETQGKFLPMLPVYARIDGRCFSKFTKGMRRPYDETMSWMMQETTKYLVENTGALTGYTQSDEISLIWYSDDIKSEIFFCRKKQKMTSILAAMATAKFLQLALENFPDKCDKSLPTFDARVFQLPNMIEGMNCFLWRVQDAVKNSVTMAASEWYSNKQLMGKNSNDKLDMLIEKGINWNDYPKFFKEGSFFKRQEYMRGDALRTSVIETNKFEKFRDLTTEEKVEFIYAKKLEALK